MQNLNTPFTLRPPSFILDALARLVDAGYDALIVGGALRDTLLKRPVLDWDIATSAECNRIRQLFSDRKTYHLRHETVTIVFPHNRLEITPYRDPNGTLEGDLARRDFTVNAMAYDPVRRELIDPWNGRKDLAQRVIRGTGYPGLRFREDPLRLLRGIRLAVELDFEIQDQTLQAMDVHAHLLRHVAPERIREELVKILMCPRPSGGFKMLSAQGLLRHIIPELCEGKGVEQNFHHQHTVFDHALETVEKVPPVLHLRLSALLHDIAKPRVRTLKGDTWRFLGHARESAHLAQQVMARLRFSRLLTEKVAHLIMNHMIEYDSQWSDGAVTRLIGKVGSDSIDDLLILRKADLVAHSTGNERARPIKELQERVASALQKKRATSVLQLAINGDGVMKLLDLEPGPRVGEILQHLLEIVIDNPHLNNPDDLQELLERAPVLE
jgi:putative nucleotidyltransferase with HDIG domain